MAIKKKEDKPKYGGSVEINVLRPNILSFPVPMRYTQTSALIAEHIFIHAINKIIFEPDGERGYPAYEFYVEYTAPLRTQSLPSVDVTPTSSFESLLDTYSECDTYPALCNYVKLSDIPFVGPIYKPKHKHLKCGALIEELNRLCEATPVERFMGLCGLRSWNVRIVPKIMTSETCARRKWAGIDDTLARAMKLEKMNMLIAMATPPKSTEGKAGLKKVAATSKLSNLGKNLIFGKGKPATKMIAADKKTKEAAEKMDEAPKKDKVLEKEEACFI
ncbi:hypothetical protein DFH27DRAFT_645046 [Peziza echinospora]|nr:hypothetical protein DFH27DRAFT_645046 [Peziza echinospora]